VLHIYDISSSEYINLNQLKDSMLELSEAINKHNYNESKKVFYKVSLIYDDDFFMKLVSLSSSFMKP